MSSRDMYIEGAHTTRVVKALASDIRLKILNLLTEEDMNIQTLANYLRISKTAALSHVNILEDAGFIESRYLSGSVGNQRVCRKIYNRLIFNFTPTQFDSDDTYYEMSVPVGNYFDFEAHPPCGLIRSNSVIKKWDDPVVFCDHERVDAILVWTSCGYLEYKIPIDPMFDGRRIKSVKIDMELSAHNFLKKHEALALPSGMTPDMVTDGISDVTFWINGIEIGTCTIGAGIDREKATYTPTWWQSNSFLHGELVDLSINGAGCYVRAKKISDLTFDSLAGGERLLRFKIGIKPGARNMAGFALFGKNCGRYYQDILVKTYIE